MFPSKLRGYRSDCCYAEAEGGCFPDDTLCLKCGRQCTVSEGGPKVKGEEMAAYELFRNKLEE
jgi:hypothetical protein